MNILSAQSYRPQRPQNSTQTQALPQAEVLEQRAQVFQDRAELSLDKMREANKGTMNGMVAAGVSTAVLMAGLVLSNVNPGAALAVTATGATGLVGGGIYSLYSANKATNLLGESMNYSSQASRLKMAAALARDLQN